MRKASLCEARGALRKCHNFDASHLSNLKHRCRETMNFRSSTRASKLSSFSNGKIWNVARSCPQINKCFRFLATSEKQFSIYHPLCLFADYYVFFFKVLNRQKAKFGGCQTDTTAQVESHSSQTTQKGKQSKGLFVALNILAFDQPHLLFVEHG